MKVHVKLEDGSSHSTLSYDNRLYVEFIFHPLWDYDSISAETLKELEGYNGWSLKDGPIYYIENTVYIAGDRDYNGLRAGEKRQRIARGAKPMWSLVGLLRPGFEVPERLQKYILKGHERPALITAHLPDLEVGERPEVAYDLAWVPTLVYGDGKDRELATARRYANWPEATDEELTAPGLKERLEARLPAKLARFRELLLQVGFNPEELK